MIEYLLEHALVIDVVAKLAGIVTVLGLFFAYQQYKHSVRVAKRAERRAAVELAAKECTHFGLNLLRNVDELHEQITQSGCEYLSHCKLIKSEKGLAVDTSAVTPEDREKIQRYNKKIVEILNSIEGFAIPFAEGVADDKVGFIECGRLFVQTIERMAPLYYFGSLNDYYKSSQDIYMRWREQIGQEDEKRKDAQVAKEIFVMSANRIRERSKSQFLRAVASWCLERAKD